MALIDSLASQIASTNTTSGATSSNWANSAMATSGTNAFGDFISLGLQNWFNKQANQESREFAEQQSQEAWNREYELYLQNLEYNKPVNQMARYKDAGLNPNLIYGQGTPGNASTTAPNYNVPQWKQVPMQAPNFSNFLNQYYDFKFKQAQIDNMNEIRKNIVAERALKITNNMLKQFEVDLWNAGKLDYQTQLWGRTLARMDAETGLFGARTFESQQKGLTAQKQRDVFEADIAYKSAQREYLRAKQGLIPYDMQLKQQQIGKTWQQQQLYLSQMAKMNEEIMWWAAKNKMFQDSGINLEKDNFLYRLFQNTATGLDKYFNREFGTPLWEY